MYLLFLPSSVLYLLSQKTPHLRTLALTKFLLELLLNNPSVWADKYAFVLPKLEIKIEQRLQGKFPLLPDDCW